MKARLVVLVVVAALLAGCSGDEPVGAEAPETGSSSGPITPMEPEETSPADLGITHKTLWLCSPEQEDDPCDATLSTTAIRADGSTVMVTVRPDREHPVDCFYVYPTVSESQEDYAPLEVTPALEDAALSQAAVFSDVCDVYAPVYRQRTVAGLIKGGLGSGAESAAAYDDVRSAFADYLSHNPDRRFVLIGHSQGSFVLTQLIRELLDGDTDEAAALRERMVSALVIGGAVKTSPGEAAGGDFQRVPLCLAPGDTGCVVAYNTYARAPGDDAIFGRPDPNRGLDAVCTNPLDLLGDVHDLHPVLPTDRIDELGATGVATPDTTFVSLPHYVTARCRSRDGFAWLQVTVRDGRPDVRPDTLPERLGPQWGLHVVDVNIALGDLVELVRRQASRSGE